MIQNLSVFINNDLGILRKLTKDLQTEVQSRSTHRLLSGLTISSDSSDALPFLIGDSRKAEVPLN